jgi:hypothetical protein
MILAAPRSSGTFRGLDPGDLVTDVPTTHVEIPDVSNRQGNARGGEASSG